MKHRVLAAAFTALNLTGLALSAAALAEQRGGPFEQTELDRAQPPVQVPSRAHAPVRAERMPFEQSQLDRTLLDTPQERVLLAQVGNLPYGYQQPAGEMVSPWANNHSFIAPAP